MLATQAAATVASQDATAAAAEARIGELEKARAAADKEKERALAEVRGRGAGMKGGRYRCARLSLAQDETLVEAVGVCNTACNIGTL